MSAAVAMTNNISCVMPGGCIKIEKQTGSTPAEAQSTFGGRLFTGFRTVAKATANAVSYPDTLHPVVRGITSIAIGLSPWAPLAKLEKTAFEADRLMDGLRFIGSDLKKMMHLQPLHQIADGRFTEAASEIAFIASDFGATMHLLGFLGIVDVAKVARGIGKVLVFGRRLPSFVADAVIGTISMQIQTIGYVFKGIHSAYQLATQDTNRRINMLWLATCIMEVIHKSFIIFCAAALTTPYGLATVGVLGVAANTLGLIVTYQEMGSEPWKQKSPQYEKPTV